MLDKSKDEELSVQEQKEAEKELENERNRVCHKSVARFSSGCL